MARNDDPPSTQPDAAAREVVYHIDADDRLSRVGGDWERFAEANAGRFDEPLLGRPIWDFIVGEEVRRVHGALLARVRRGDSLPPLPFRCDAPDLRRHMEMRLRLLDRDGVEYRCRLVRAVPRRLIVLPPRQAEAATDFVRLCSWCNRVSIGREAWAELDAVVEELELFAGSLLAYTTPVLCEQCHQHLGDLAAPPAD